MVTFWPRQSTEISVNVNEHAMEILHKACLAGLDAVLHQIVLETVGNKKPQRLFDGTSMLDSIRFSLNCLQSIDTSIQLSHMLEEADLLLLHDRCLLTTATHAHLGRSLIHVLRCLDRPTNYPSSSALNYPEILHNLRAVLDNMPVMLDQYTRNLRHVLTHEEDEEPPAYRASNDYGMLVEDAKPPKYDDELDRIMDALSRISLQYDNQRANRSYHKEQAQSLTDLLAKSLHRPGFSRQRYMLSDTKERELFFTGLFHKVDRLQSRRFRNQDAEPPRNAINVLLQHIARAKRSSLENQRAEFSCLSPA